MPVRTAFLTAVVLWGVVVMPAEAQVSVGAASNNFSVRAVVEGVVRTATLPAVVGAAITISSPTGGTRTATSDTAGRFRIDAVGTDPELLLNVTALGFRSVRRRLVLEALGTPIDVVLVPFVEAVDEVKIRANRAPPSQWVYEPRIGSAASIAGGVRAVTPVLFDGIAEALRNDLFLEAGGAIGLNSSETSTSLNGLASSIAALPRSLPVSIKAGVGEYEITAGGFSGARIAVDVQPAGEFARRSGDIVSVVQNATVPAGSPQSSQTQLADVGGSSRLGLNGPGLTWGARVEHRLRTTASLADVQTEFSFRDSAVARGLWSSMALARQAETWSASSVFRLDLSPNPNQTNAAIFSLARADNAPFLGALASSPSRAQSRSTQDLTMQYLLRRSWRRTAFDVRLSANDASVLEGERGSSPVAVIHVPVIGTPDADLLGANEALLGGGGRGATTRSGGLEGLATAETAVGAGGRWTNIVLIGGRRGSYEKAEQTPSSDIFFSSPNAFVRLDSARGSIVPAFKTQGSVSRMTTGMGISGPASRTVKLMIGIRGDVQRLEGPGGQRQSVDVLPRLGLTWTFRPPEEGAGYLQSDLLSRHLVPPGVLRVGVGQFVNDATADISALPGGTAPASAYTSCWLSRGAGGLGDGEASTLSPAALTQTCASAADSRRESRARLGDGYRPSRSTRATASFLTRMTGVDVQVEGIVAYNDRQAQRADVAVAKLPVVLWPSGPAFFAPASSIRHADGTVTRPAVGVGDSGFTRDLRVESTGRSVSERIVLSFASQNGRGRTAWRVGYAIGRTTSLESGFQRDANGSPWEMSWGPARGDRRHQIQFEVGRNFLGVYATAWARAMSGVPYSPVADGDINGDGIVGNDRVSSTQASDTNGVHALALLPTSARNCIAEGALRRGTCRAPWDVLSGITFAVDPWNYARKQGVPITIAIDNPLAMIAQWAGRAAWRELASGAAVDPVLLRPVSFAPSTGFQYVVNPGFGRRQPALVSASGYRVSVSVRVPLSPSIQHQQLDRWMAYNGLGQRLTSTDLGRRFARNVPNVLDEVLTDEIAESLVLSATQRDTLQTRRRLLADSLSTIWQSLGESLSSTGESRGSAATLALVQRATDAAWEANRRAANQLVGLFSPLQEALLPGTAKMLLHATKPVTMRVVFY